MRRFDPTRVADLELRMWQAYYVKERVRLFSLLVTMLHEQYRYSWATATTEALYLARAAATFGDLKGDYNQVLPDLEAAYEKARSWHDARFDPRAVARAELAWWVARRIPGQNTPDEVGLLIAEENAMLYEVPRDVVLDAAVLRATAGRLRDEGGEQADWKRVSELLQQSFRALHGAVNR